MSNWSKYSSFFKGVMYLEGSHFDALNSENLNTISKLLGTMNNSINEEIN